LNCCFDQMMRKDSQPPVPEEKGRSPNPDYENCPDLSLLNRGPPESIGPEALSRWCGHRLSRIYSFFGSNSLIIFQSPGTLGKGSFKVLRVIVFDGHVHELMDPNKFRILDARLAEGLSQLCPDRFWDSFRPEIPIGMSTNSNGASGRTSFSRSTDFGSRSTVHR